MKKIMFFLTLFFMIHQLTAQTWCPAGATWHYGFYNGYTKLQYTSDTIINSIACKKIESYSEWYWAGILHTNNENNYYTYSDIGVNYIYNNRFGQNRFDTLFNINAQIGDNWKMPLTDTLCNDSINTVTVIDTGHTVINSQVLKWLYVKINDNPIGGYSLDTIIENFGYTKRFFYYYDYCSLYEGFDYYSLRCYSDNIFGYYNFTPLLCDFTISTDEIVSLSGFQLYPNPSANELTLEFEQNNSENTLLEIKNLLGQTLYSETFKTNIGKQTKNIDVSLFQNGVYFIKLKSQDKIYSARFIKQ